MTSLGAIEFATPFCELKRLVVEHLLEWGKGERTESFDLSQFDAIIAIKNSERVVTGESGVFRKLLMDGRSGLGSNVDSTGVRSFRKISQVTDGLILDGVASLELEHVGPHYNLRPCSFITYKRRLDELQDPSFVILTISRPVAYLGTSNVERRRSLNELVSLLQQLDATDQEICQGYARGDSSREIGAMVGLTTRSVEIRRQKILAHFGFERPIEIVKMLVRLDERGLA
ncbi:response regulator transcription factor [Rubripirellula reticaptiva]|uniref:hypothetical protein n=1 Tax=Rubripirellula reticaptiva TaxID=2528013 RepID=UPI001C950023|nr:hypothetical protein [Rubripirellula reticaptiva]